MSSSNIAKPISTTTNLSLKEDNDTSSESSLNNQTIDDFDVDTYWHDSMKVSWRIEDIQLACVIYNLDAASIRMTWI